ncbi:terminase family protein [Candidatus Regnicoccus frigidus]|uniref:phage terminase large subunit family protein n=1 Tax=Candidatus Regnicoccus frigidus TaxID=3074015 RepID=UPI0028BE3DB7|nr:terminase family protein [Candidatus Regnicoccus frigidus]
MAWDDNAWAEYDAKNRALITPYQFPHHGLHRPRKRVQPILRHLPRRPLFTGSIGSNLWDNLPKQWPHFAARTTIASQGKYLPFIPWEVQLNLVRMIRSTQNVYCLKSRQTGVSETVINYMLMMAIENPAWVGIVFSKTGEDASELAARIKGQAASLGSFCPPLPKDSARKLQFLGRGSLHFLPPTERAARGIPSASMVLFDEGAFIERLSGIETGAMPTLSLLGPRARAVWVSTPNGRSGRFHEHWTTDHGEIPLGPATVNGIPTLARSPDGQFGKVAIHWSQHPIFAADPDYQEKTKRKFQLTQQRYQQEFELDFTATDAEVYPHELIEAAEAIGALDDPTSGNVYVIGIDPNGGADDEFVTTVLDVTASPWQVVARFNDSRRSRDYGLQRSARLIDQFAPELIVIEKNGVGAAVAESLARLRPGYPIEEVATSRPSKVAMTDRVLLLLEQGELGLPPNDIYGEQMRVFRQHPDGTREAAAGAHDDAVMSLAMACEAGARTRPMVAEWVNMT